MKRMLIFYRNYFYEGIINHSTWIPNEFHRLSNVRAHNKDTAKSRIIRKQVKNMKTKLRMASAALTALTIAASIGITAFAAEPNASYGYLTGQQNNTSRHAQFEEAVDFTSAADREAFFEAQGIGGDGPYSAAQYLDAEELVKAGIIDQSTADKITTAAVQKHDALHAKYASKSDTTPEELHSFYESFKSDGFDGDSVSELLSNGIITQEQADEINGYLSK